MKRRMNVKSCRQKHAIKGHDRWKRIKLNGWMMKAPFQEEKDGFTRWEEFARELWQELEEAMPNDEYGKGNVAMYDTAALGREG